MSGPFPPLYSSTTAASTPFSFLYSLTESSFTLFVHPLGDYNFQEANDGNSRWWMVHYALHYVLEHVDILGKTATDRATRGRILVSLGDETDAHLLLCAHPHLCAHAHTNIYKFKGIIWPSFISMALLKCIFFSVWEPAIRNQSRKSSLYISKLNSVKEVLSLV